MADKMTYGGYTWPHNPRRLSMKLARRIHVMESGLGSDVLQDIGEQVRMVEGEGEFFGENAHADFYALRARFEQGGALLLSLPGFTPFMARFKELRFTEQAGPQIVSYAFAFIEDRRQSGLAGQATTVHTVLAGENLWTIALLYSLPIEQLLSLNATLRDPFDVRVGQIVRLR